MPDDMLIGKRGEIATRFADAAKLSFIAIDDRGIIQFVNPAAASLFGYLKEEMIGRPVDIIIPERFRSAHNNGLARVVAGARPNLGGRPVEVAALRKDGTEFPIEITMCVWHDDAGMAAGAIIKDITEFRQREGRLLRLATRDTLTGLLNVNGFCELVRAELLSGKSGAVVVLDLDGFKDMNGTLGHQVGDALLQAVGVRLTNMLPMGAEVARVGSDEFAMLLPGISSVARAAAGLDSIFELFDEPFHVAGHVLEVTVTVGVALASPDGLDERELLAGADYALQHVKPRAGRKWRMFDEELRCDIEACRSMRDELLNALRRGELVMHYQPQIDLRTGGVWGVEALIRWNHPTRGTLPPGLFLPALEQSALALEIGWWTLDQACAQLARFDAAGHRGIKMGVNLFPAQLRAPNLCRRVSEALEKHGVDPGCLELEVTETIALSDDDKSLEALAGLREIGVRIAFDDFGTGFASLSSLRRFPLTTLKIDRTFVAEILSSAADAAITRALVAMSNDLGLETIAEGVETEDQVVALSRLGCPVAQGYRYGKAMPSYEIERFLEQRATDVHAHALVQCA